MIKLVIQAVMLLVSSELTASTAPKFEEHAPPSLADHLHLSPPKGSIDHGWLPNLTGLPNDEQINLMTEDVADLILREKDKRCSSVNMHLRLLMFQHFVIHQHMANAQNIYFDEQIAKQWAHVLAMILKESSGDSTNITDMKGHSLSTYMPKTNLLQWKKILALTKKGHIQFNHQTNFGLTQTSADRLFNAFHLARNKFYNTTFLEGKQGASIPKNSKLNTAIAIRRLIWFYQDFAQGRISQAHRRLHQYELSNPKLFAQYQLGLEKAVVYCGTRFMFRENHHQIGSFRQAIASIAYCKLGNSTKGYGLHEMDQRCFAQWVTLCPALNIDIAILTPLSYFATRKEKPVCEKTFKQLINKKKPLANL